MLGAEGLQQADDLGVRLCGLFDYLKSHCTKQPYYDWGLRKLKAVTVKAGKEKRSSSFCTEREMITAAVQSLCSSSIAPIDESVFARGLIDHFGSDAFVPMPIPRDFWNAAATKMSRAISSRHGSLCLPVLESDETFVMAVLEEEAAKVGARVVCMPGRTAECSESGMIGGLVNGRWNDGVFTNALKDAVKGEKPGWLVVFCGREKFESGLWTQIHSLLDDNKVLRLENGESVHLRPEDRIIFAARDVDNASPALVSRLGIINVEAHHRNRL